MRFEPAILPDRWRAAGLPLATHTLGHALLLRRLDSPYAGRPAAGGDPAEPWPLGCQLTALWVCSRPWRAALNGLDTARQVLWLHWQQWRRGDQAERLHRDLCGYLRAAWPEIEVWESEAPRRTLGTDYLHLLLLTERRLGLSYEAALEVPLALACWDALAEAERVGVVRIRTDWDEQVSAELDRLYATGALPEPGMIADGAGGWRWPDKPHAKN